MVVGLLGNENPDLNRFTLVTPKPANGVRLQATLDNQNPTGLPVGAVRWITYISRKKIISFDKQKSTKNRMFSCFFNTHEF